MPLTPQEVEINKAILSIEMAKANFRDVPTGASYKVHSAGMRHLRSAKTRLDKLITAGGQDIPQGTLAEGPSKTPPSTKGQQRGRI